MNEMDRLYARLSSLEDQMTDIAIQQAKTETLMKVIIAIGSLLIANLIPLTYKTWLGG